MEFRLTAPAWTFAELRTATPATGSPPSTPDTTLAAPWPSSSRSRSERPTRAADPDRPAPPASSSGREATSLSTATAPSSDCTLHTSVVVSTAATMPSTGPSGSPASAWLRQDGRSTLGRLSPASAAVRVAPLTATSAAGTLRSALPARPGSRGQASSRVRVSTLIDTAAGCRPANWAGSARTLSRTELSGVPPSTMCSWATAMVTPIPASMPWTTAGLTASAVRATRRQPRPSWASPARTVMAQVVRHPYRWMRSAVTTVSPAAGPLTWSGEPPSRPATSPPTAAATRPAWSGAPVARAMPRDRGRAIRKTAMEADRSAPAMRKRRGGVGGGGGLWGWCMRFVRVGSGARVGTQADMFPVSSGAARSRNRWSPVDGGGRVAAVGHGVQAAGFSTLGKRIVMHSKGRVCNFGANGVINHSVE